MESTDNQIILSPQLENLVQQAVELFMQGYSCSQSVAMAFAGLYGIDRNTACRMATGFGGGVGRMRMMCGAISGFVMLAGLDVDKEGSASAKSDCYKVVQELVETFRKRNGSIICAELLKGCPVSPGSKASERNAQYYKVRPCAQKVESAARIFAEYLQTKH